MMRALCVAVWAALMLATCHKLSPGEEKLIGTWSSHSMDAGWVTTFRPDHTLRVVFDQGTGEGLPGVWQIQGSELVTVLDLKQLNIGEPYKKVQREKIIRFDKDIIQIKGGSPYVRVVPSKLSSADAIHLAGVAALKRNIHVEQLSIPIVFYDRGEEGVRWRVWWYRKPFRLNMTPRDRVVGAVIKDQTGEVSLVRVP